jgi:hypothetical protein
MILLLSIHLAMNYAAVRAVSMHTLNRQRANIVMSRLIEHGIVATPEEVAAEERIFEKEGVLRWGGSRIVGYCRLGVELRTMLDTLASRREGKTSAYREPSLKFADIADVFRDEEYVLWYDWSRSRFVVVLKQGASPVSQLRAWTHALRAAYEMSISQNIASWSGTATSPSHAVLSDPLDVLKVVGKVQDELRRNFDSYVPRLKAAGWDVEAGGLETQSGTRISTASNA